MNQLAASAPGASRTPRVVYWVSTALIGLLMLGGGLGMLFSSANRVALTELGFPRWFATELGIAKLLGVAAVVLPRVPLRVREWAYGGFAVILVSASLAHFNAGQPVWRSAEPLGFLAVLVASRWTLPVRDARSGSLAEV